MEMMPVEETNAGMRQKQRQSTLESNGGTENSQVDEVSALELFKQQMLRAWQPVPTLTKTTVLFFIMALIFLGIGIPMLVLSTDINEITVRYDDVCSNNTTCTITLPVQQQMSGPVFVYYQLHNFYQNHRLYARSLSTKQLLGRDLAVYDIQTECYPIVTNSDLYVNKSITNDSLIGSAPANPCGMIAYSLFNDSFVIPNVTITEDGISWPTDAQKFVITNASVLWTNISSPRFQNWMRIAALPNFRKLWGKIQNGLSPGNYTVNINNLYNVTSFQSEKYFVVSTANFFGSRNEFLSITYIVCGGMCLLIGGLFLGKKLMKKYKQS